MPTISVSMDLLRSYFRLRPEADEAAIRAAIAQPAPKPVRAAAPASVPAARPLLDAAARVQAASDAELRQLAGTPLSVTDREAVADELGHRELLASHFPQVADAQLGHRARIHRYE